MDITAVLITAIIMISLIVITKIVVSSDKENKVSLKHNKDLENKQSSISFKINSKEKNNKKNKITFK
ncbi:hypothetical protein [Clostridium thermobutyricum]|uniref:Uncharacterized protein n=1 Tax=Clostridium thermobutyricum DSM 4928 TaxID=1121339 RepID=A0A1V4SSP0_9CLOT|nr:hypothetical protein [Clostridium thermobutyricum]OPX46862.1 hypothetical protein CLTHE_24660 [Clostridium thermobutyricum DSM 4928]